MAAPKAPTGLGARGKRTWKAMTTEGMAPEQVLMLEEVCRTADRLDKLDALLRGDVSTWAQLVADDGGDYELKVDPALAEARQQQNVFKQMLVTVRQLEPGKKPQERGSRGAYDKSASSAVKDEVSEKRATRGWRSA